MSYNEVFRHFSFYCIRNFTIILVHFHIYPVGSPVDSDGIIKEVVRIIVVF